MLNSRDMDDALGAVSCGAYDCLFDCPCEVLVSFIAMMAAADTDQGSDLLDAGYRKNGKINACGIGPSCSPPIPPPPGVPQLPDPGPGPIPDPGQPDPNPNAATCLDRLVTTVCTPSNQLKMTAIQIMVTALSAVTSGLPVTTTFLGGVKTLVTSIQAFCSNPQAGSVPTLLNTVCAYWPSVKATVPTLLTNFITKPLGDSLTLIIGSDVGKALDECCVNTAVRTIPVLPPVNAATRARLFTPRRYQQ